MQLKEGNTRAVIRYNVYALMQSGKAKDVALAIAKRKAKKWELKNTITYHKKLANQ